MSEFTSQVDARQYEPKDKHNVIFDTFHNLKKGEKGLVIRQALFIFL